ncbi:MAG: hypothetical protein AB8B55_06530 [Mariniblastus sp.]
MIKPLNVPQLSSVKARTGLQRIGDLIPRLIRQYELQAELVKRREEHTRNEHARNRASINVGQPVPAIAMESVATEQATFGWYE